MEVANSSCLLIAFFVTNFTTDLWYPSKFWNVTQLNNKTGVILFSSFSLRTVTSFCCYNSRVQDGNLFFHLYHSLHFLKSNFIISSYGVYTCSSWNQYFYTLGSIWYLSCSIYYLNQFSVDILMLKVQRQKQRSS